MEKINETIAKAKNEVKELIKLAQLKQLEPEPGRTMMESFENRVNQVCFLYKVLHYCCSLCFWVSSFFDSSFTCRC